MISEEEYNKIPEWAKPFPIRRNPSQIKHKALKCPFCGAIFSEKEKLEHLSKEPDGRIYCPIAKGALEKMQGDTHKFYFSHSACKYRLSNALC